MTLTIRQVGPCFAGEVDGIDMRSQQTRDEVAAIHAGMDKSAVLVFHDQKIGDEEHLAFTRSLGDIEPAVGTSLLVITANSLAALLARAGTAQSLDWAVVAPFAGAAVLGAWDGKRLAARVSGGTLQRIFAWALLAVAALMFLDVAL